MSNEEFKNYMQENITDNGKGYGQHIGCAEIVKKDTRIKDKF